MKGWYNDSIRHSLARKGIKTKIKKFKSKKIKNNEKRWVYGTRTKKWELVDKNDRDYEYGISQSEMKRIGKKKAKEKFLKPVIWVVG